jgi:hypothetical protein
MDGVCDIAEALKDSWLELVTKDRALLTILALCIRSV